MRSVVFALALSATSASALAATSIPAAASAPASEPASAPPSAPSLVPASVPAAQPPSPTTSAAAVPAAQPERPQILLLNLEHVPSEVPPDKVAILQGRIASSLSERRALDLVTTADLKAMADLEAEKSLVGCDERSCLAELAAALGARYVVFGRIGKLDDTLILQLNLFDAHEARAEGRAEVSAASLKEIADRVPGALSTLLVRLGPLGAVEATPTANTSGAPPSVLLVSGGALLGVGTLGAVGFGIMAFQYDQVLSSSTADTKRRDEAYKNLWTGWAAIGSGAAALVGAGLLAVDLLME